METGATPATFWAGFVRTAFPFFAGVMLYRLKDAPALAWPVLPVAVPALALFAALNVPVLGHLQGTLADLACVLLAFPLILALAVRCRPGEAAARACKGLGELSYPLYVLHYPIYVIVGGVAWHAGWLSDATERTVGALSLLVILAASLAALFLYDRPLRRRLSRLGRPATARRATAAAASARAPEPVDA